MKIFTYLLIMGVLSCVSYLTLAAELKVKVVDQEGKPVEYAVVYLVGQQETEQQRLKVIDQQDKEFIPYVTALKRGDAINFPNNDNIRHQVYSFSQAKQFELPLYKGNPERPVKFNQTGAVALACNIHDWMSAYVYVVESDKFVVTDKAGNGSIDKLNAGEHQVKLWHPKQQGQGNESTHKVVINDSGSQLTLTMTKQTKLRAWRAPKSFARRGY